MNRKALVWISCLGVLTAGAIAAARYPIKDREKDPPSAAKKTSVSDDAKPESAEAVAVRETNREFVRAFERGDAKAIAALWTENGEYDSADAEPIHGRAAIEAVYARFFKDNPKATLEGHIESLRMLGSRAAMEEGTLCSRLPEDKESGPTRFSAFLVLEEKGWRFASVREWVPEPTERVSLQDIAWLAGDWVGKGKDAEAKLSYTFDEGKAFLQGHYTVSREGKIVSSGMQIIGKDPNGGLRSWQFEGDGGFGEWTWSHDGSSWVILATGSRPDGDTETATNLLIPIDKDAFTWQVLERTTGGVAQTGQPPVKVTRVKAHR